MIEDKAKRGLWVGIGGLAPILLLAVALAVGHLASRERRARGSAEASSGEIRRIHRIAAVAIADLVGSVLAPPLRSQGYGNG